MWDKLVRDIEEKANDFEDKHIIAMVSKMKEIPGHLKHTVLRYYNQKCAELHALAFLQWRYRFPSKLNYNEKDLIFLIQQRIRS